MKASLKAPSAGSAVRPRRSPLALLLLAVIRLYQLVPHASVQRCRFYPTCSAYALDAVRAHGALAGSWLAVRRLGRCHPWNPGGVDHVPPRRTTHPDRAERSLEGIPS